MTAATLGIVLGFARTLRHAGVPATPDRVQAMVTALDHLDVASPVDTYWAGRLTLCGDPADIARYDAAFAAYFGRVPLVRPPRVVTRLRAVPLEADEDEGTGEGGDAQLVGRASRQEVLRHRDLAALSAAERDEVRRMLRRHQIRDGRRQQPALPRLPLLEPLRGSRHVRLYVQDGAPGQKRWSRLSGQAPSRSR